LRKIVKLTISYAKDIVGLILSHTAEGRSLALLHSFAQTSDPRPGTLVCEGNTSSLTGERISNIHSGTTLAEILNTKMSVTFLVGYLSTTTGNRYIDLIGGTAMKPTWPTYSRATQGYEGGEGLDALEFYKRVAHIYERTVKKFLQLINLPTYQIGHIVIPVLHTTFYANAAEQRTAGVCISQQHLRHCSWVSRVDKTTKIHIRDVT
jgi:hypothetical protein